MSRADVQKIVQALGWLRCSGFEPRQDRRAGARCLNQVICGVLGSSVVFSEKGCVTTRRAKTCTGSVLLVHVLAQSGTHWADASFFTPAMKTFVQLQDALFLDCRSEVGRTAFHRRVSDACSSDRMGSGTTLKLHQIFMLQRDGARLLEELHPFHVS